MDLTPTGDLANGAGDQVCGGSVPPAQVLHHSQKMQRVGVFGLCRQDVTIDPFGLGEPAGTVMIERARQQFTGVHYFRTSPRLEFPVLCKSRRRVPQAITSDV